MKKTELSAFQLFAVTCISMLFGMTLFPSAVGHDITCAWFIAQFVTALLMFGVLLLAVRTAEACPEGDFAKAVTSLTGIVSKPLLALLGCYFLIQASRLLIMESDNLMLFLFEKTPVWAVIAVFCVCVLAVGFSGLIQTAKTAEILVPVFLLLLTALFALLLFRCDTGELKTLFQPDISEIPRQAVLSMNSFSCIELAFFAFFETKRKHRRRGLIAGYIVDIILMLTAFLALTGTYTVRAGAELVFPFTELTRSIELDSIDILERFDVIFIGFRITVCVLFSSLACNFGARSFAAAVGKPDLRLYVPVSAALFVIIFLCYKLGALSLLTNITFWGECAVLLLLFPCLFILSQRKKGDEK